MTVGIDSWTSLLEANIYFEKIWDGTFWPSLSDHDKEKLLTTAFFWILASGYNISASATADAIKYAQCELAIEVYNSYEEYKRRATLKASGVISFNNEGWSETLKEQELPARIKFLLKDYATGRGGRTIQINRNYD